MNLPMQVRKVVANKKVKNDIGKVALQRGPLVYCAEWKDNDGRVSNIIVPANASFEATYRPELLNGITILKGALPVIMIDAEKGFIDTQQRTVTAIPYYAWANRGKGEMTVWFPSQVKDVDIITAESKEVIQGK